jgi:glycosyltransferase involved in cell wall biosynthesis
VAGEEKTRVVHVIARMNVGGPAILISELLRGLNNEKFESKLITGFCEENEVDYLQANNLSFGEKRVKGFGRSVSMLADIKSLFLIMLELRKLRPDIVHTHTAKAGVIGRITSFIAVPRAKRVHTFHGHLLHGYFSPFKTKLVILTEKILSKITHSILTVGNKVKVDLLAAGIGNENKMKVTFPGLNVASKKPKSDMRAELNLSEDEVVLIFVGRLTHIKRPDRLINAFRLASSATLKMTLIVVGDGELRNESERFAAGLSVKFLGWRTDVYDLMKAADIAILTSDNEGMPITLIEAAHLGLPSISTEVGSVSDVVVNARTGYLTPLNEEVISERIKQLAQSPSLRDKFGSAAKSHAKENFSVESMINFHANLYKKLAR